ncbi:hypothetical protein PsYK624_140920 [Phanerochaete sordida]|uniref:Uncharacterized protein n=1 Tax=Phanerochaete sordida TaxID=48140 RepID=A0A9P3LK00_9APHY|nr:hypothetical protein PsYK624_140920 [Phanerochaete sordida]
MFVNPKVAFKPLADIVLAFLPRLAFDSGHSLPLPHARRHRCLPRPFSPTEPSQTPEVVLRDLGERDVPGGMLIQDVVPGTLQAPDPAPPTCGIHLPHGREHPSHARIRITRGRRRTGWTLRAHSRQTSSLPGPRASLAFASAQSAAPRQGACDALLRLPPPQEQRRCKAQRAAPSFAGRPRASTCGQWPREPGGNVHDFACTSVFDLSATRCGHRRPGVGYTVSNEIVLNPV